MEPQHRPYESVGAGIQSCRPLPFTAISPDSGPNRFPLQQRGELQVQLLANPNSMGSLPTSLPVTDAWAPAAMASLHVVAQHHLCLLSHLFFSFNTDGCARCCVGNGKPKRTSSQSREPISSYNFIYSASCESFI